MKHISGIELNAPILIWFNAMRWITRRIREFIHGRLVESTPLLPGFEYVRLIPSRLRHIHRSRNRCKLVGHIWELEHTVSIEHMASNHGFTSNDTSEDTFYVFNLKCNRCFPHAYSRRITKFHDLFAVSHKDQG